MLKRTSQSYATIDEMKELPEWQTTIDAMNEYAEQQVKNLSLSAVSNCACSVDETTGWTEVKCCNICGKPIKGQNWHCC